MQIDNKLIDFKTHDVSGWTDATVMRNGTDHAKQVRGYVDSPDTPDDAQGFIIAAGREPVEAAARNAYVNSAAAQGITAQFPENNSLQALSSTSRTRY